MCIIYAYDMSWIELASVLLLNMMISKPSCQGSPARVMAQDIDVPSDGPIDVWDSLI